jgi:hypothetical protein
VGVQERTLLVVRVVQEAQEMVAAVLPVQLD